MRLLTQGVWCWWSERQQGRDCRRPDAQAHGDPNLLSGGAHTGGKQSARICAAQSQVGRTREVPTNGLTVWLIVQVCMVIWLAASHTISAGQSCAYKRCWLAVHATREPIPTIDYAKSTQPAQGAQRWTLSQPSPSWFRPCEVAVVGWPGLHFALVA